MRERRLDAVAGIVRQRQRDRSGRRYRAVMSETGTDLRQLLNHMRGHRGDALHVAAVSGV